MEREDGDPSRVKWDKKFELGIPAIDAQHEHLVKLTDNFYAEIIRCVVNGSKELSATLSDVLRETVNYALTHFQLEEKLMAAAGYDGLARHKAKHHEFIKEVEWQLLTFHEADLQSALDFFEFLYNWLFEHIAFEDKLYAKKIKEYLATREHDADVG